MDALHEKSAALAASLGALGSLAVAFSAGVDSTFLLAAAHRALGDRAFAVTADLCSMPRSELEAAVRFCRAQGIRQVIVPFDMLRVPGVKDNPPERCYLCKRALFTALLAAAREQGAAFLAEGSNTDDMGDYRPGLRAIAELKVKSPFRDAGLSKAEIRALSKEWGLDTYDKPSYACLATRIPYGETITPEKLAMAERAEAALHALGFRQVRVRLHGTLARIEILPEAFGDMLAPEVRAAARQALQEIGFEHVSLDLAGYRMGSMNAGILK